MLIYSMAFNSLSSLKTAFPLEENQKWYMLQRNTGQLYSRGEAKAGSIFQIDYHLTKLKSSKRHGLKVVLENIEYARQKVVWQPKLFIYLDDDLKALLVAVDDPKERLYIFTEHSDLLDYARNLRVGNIVSFTLPGSGREAFGSVKYIGPFKDGDSAKYFGIELSEPPQDQSVPNMGSNLFKCIQNRGVIVPMNCLKLHTKTIKLTLLETSGKHPLESSKEKKDDIGVGVEEAAKPPVIKKGDVVMAYTKMQSGHGKCSWVMGKVLLIHDREVAVEVERSYGPLLQPWNGFNKGTKLLSHPSRQTALVDANCVKMLDQHTENVALSIASQKGLDNGTVTCLSRKLCFDWPLLAKHFGYRHDEISRRLGSHHLDMSLNVLKEWLFANRENGIEKTKVKLKNGLIAIGREDLAEWMQRSVEEDLEEKLKKISDEKQGGTFVDPVAFGSQRVAVNETSVPAHENLNVSSMVEVTWGDKILPGLIKWIGVMKGLEEHGKIAGVELEEFAVIGAGGGKFGDTTYFSCQPGRGLFVPLSRCRPDSRFPFKSDTYHPKGKMKKEAKSQTNLDYSGADSSTKVKVNNTLSSYEGQLISDVTSSAIKELDGNAAVAIDMGSDDLPTTQPFQLGIESKGQHLSTSNSRVSPVSQVEGLYRLSQPSIGRSLEGKKDKTAWKSHRPFSLKSVTSASPEEEINTKKIGGEEKRQKKLLREVDDLPSLLEKMKTKCADRVKRLEESKKMMLTFKSKSAELEAKLHQTKLNLTSHQKVVERLQKEVEDAKKQTRRGIEPEEKIRKLLMAEHGLTWVAVDTVFALREEYELGECIEAVKAVGDNLQQVQGYFQKCTTCFIHFGMHKLVALPTCECLICTECFTQYFTVLAKTTTSMYKFSCPACNNPNLEDSDQEIFQFYFSFLGTLLKTYLEMKDYELYEVKLATWGLMEDPNFRWCAHGCSAGFINERQQKRIQCPECKKYQCFDCKKPWLEQHANISCETFDAWKKANDPEFQQQGLAAHLKENGINCPKCKMRYELARGGCMHFKCPRCHHQFCCGCNLPFRTNPACNLLPSCKGKGLHAHHPRDCFYYLRDEDCHDLQVLLQKHKILYNATSNAAGYIGERPQVCPVKEQQETPDGLVDATCGKPLKGQCGLCENHYKEYLVGLINQHNIDPVEVFGVENLEATLRRNYRKIPVQAVNEANTEYCARLRQEVQQLLPLRPRNAQGAAGATYQI